MRPVRRSHLLPTAGNTTFIITIIIIIIIIVVSISAVIIRSRF